MCVLALSNVLSRNFSRYFSFLVNLLASWVVLPIYIGIETWIGLLSSMFLFPVGQALYAGSLVAIALLLSLVMSRCRTSANK